ncbi:MAG: LysR family transcriptional regulator [Chloroflexi bacterium]|nr:LysR family transcriptional regulator [Chloroflexota bacterium]
MLNLYKLEIFRMVVEAGSFSRAADRLYLSQSAISQHIQDLEASLGTRLFERGPRGVRLTPAGAILQEYTRCILNLLAEAENAVMNVEEISSGQLRIGATPGVGGYLLPEWIQTFRTRYPHLVVSLQTDVTARITAALLNRTLDIGFIEGELDEDDTLAALVLESVPQRVVVGHNHPWYGQTSIAVTQLRGQPFIVRPPHSQTRIWLEQMLNRYNIEPVIAAELDSPEAIKQAVIAGMGISILPEYVIRRERELRLLNAIEVADADLRRDLKLVWAQRQPLNPIVRAFMLHLSSQFPQVLKPLSAFPPPRVDSGIRPVTDTCPR